MPVTIRNPSVSPDLHRYKGEPNYDLTSEQALTYVWGDKTVGLKGGQNIFGVYLDRNWVCGD
jgi:hypothetical protein